MRLSIVTNIPTPYRNPVYEILAKELGNNFIVLFSAKREPNRDWQLPALNFKHVFLREQYIKKKEPYAHNNLDVLSHLWSFCPDVVITTGYNPTHIYAWAYTQLMSKKHIPMTDGWEKTEQHLSILHVIVRKIVFRSSHAFIGGSTNSMRLFSSYGVSKEHIFKSHLCVFNDSFKPFSENVNRNYDLMFSGRFSEIKIPNFFVEVVDKISRRLPGMKVLVLGDGPLKMHFLSRLASTGVSFDYPGFVSQDELPKYYASARLFLFTTKADAWGIVANEAMAAGTPVISTPYAGIVDDLLIDGENGYILDLDADTWADTIFKIFSEQNEWKRLSKNAVDAVKEFNFQNAANGIIKASKHALQQ